MDIKAAQAQHNKFQLASATNRDAANAGHDRRKRLKGLYRPKKSLNFQIPAGLPSKSTASPSNSDEVYMSETRILLLDLIIRRNKNQHRAQPFFKYICLLRRSVARLIALHRKVFSLAVSIPTSGLKAEAVRHRFEAEAGLRSQIEVLEEYVREILVPQCYVLFTSLVADSQFANLGVVLVALLSEIAAGPNGIGLMQQEERIELPIETGKVTVEENGTSFTVGSGSSLLGRSTRVTGEDHGEVIERRYDLDHEQDVPAEALARNPGDQGGFKDDAVIRPLSKIQQQPPEVAPSELDVDAPAVGKVITTFRPDTANVPETRKKSVKKEEKTKKPKDAIDDLFSGLL